MKKMIAILLAAALSLSLAACGNSANEPGSDPPPSLEFPQSQEPASVPEEPSPSGHDENDGNETILVAYFSWADNAILAEDVDAVASPSVLVPGNVQQLAGWVQEETGVDLFAIRVTEPYPSDWDACLARANQERGDQARPALQEQVEDLEQYDTVFLGCPNWWSDAPMAVYTFLESYDFTGKTLITFNTSASGGFGRSLTGIEEMPQVQRSWKVWTSQKARWETQKTV